MYSQRIPPIYRPAPAYSAPQRALRPVEERLSPQIARMVEDLRVLTIARATIHSALSTSQRTGAYAAALRITATS